MTATSGQGGQIGAQVHDEAVESVAEAMFDACKWGLFAETAWDSLGTGWKVVWRDRARQVLEAAAPILTEAGRADVTEYTICALPRGHREWDAFTITVSYRGPGQWAVLRHRSCLGSDGEWDYESRPSERTDEWKAAHRFDLDTALRLAREAAPAVTVNSYTAAEVAAWEPVDGGGDRG